MYELTNSWRATALAAIFAILLSACAGPSSWQRVGTTQVVTSVSKSFSVNAPSGWMQATSRNADTLLFTRDGTSLQSMSATYVSQWKSSNGSAQLTSGPVNVSELRSRILADEETLANKLRTLTSSQELSVDTSTSALVTHEADSVTIAGVEGVKVKVQYRDIRGAMYTKLIYAIPTKTGVSKIEYAALSRKFFDRDLQTFEEFANSYRPLIR